MTPEDREWIRQLVQTGQLHEPVLELGTGYGGNTCRDLFTTAGMRHYGTDLADAPGVDFIANFENPEDLRVFSGVGPFGTVLVLNVLEHTFDPIRILDHCVSLVGEEGKCVIITPCAWPLHKYPIDVWRPLPDFYEEYARRRGLRLEDKHFVYVGRGAVASHRNGDGYRFPTPERNALGHFWSRAIHKLFNTCGRGMAYPSHLAIGAVLQKSRSVTSGKDEQHEVLAPGRD